MATACVDRLHDQLRSLGRLVGANAQLPQPCQTMQQLHNRKDLTQSFPWGQRRCFCISNTYHRQQRRTPLVARAPRHEPQRHI